MNTRTATEQTPTLYNISKETMTSLEIAELTGKPHNDLLKSIRNMEEAWTKVQGGKFSLTSRRINLPNGGYREVPCYELTKRECLYIATKFNDEARAKLILRWEELEKEKRNGGFAIPQTLGEALMLAAKQQFQIEEQVKKIAALNEEQERLLVENTKKDETINEQGEQIIKLTSDISQMQPKVDYCDIILQSNSTVLITQIAQDYGYSAVSFNKKLSELHIQHKVNNQWILYAPYLSLGYVQSKPVNIPLPDGTTKVRLNTEWTQKGRLFLYEKLKSHNIVPLIEK